MAGIKSGDVPKSSQGDTICDRCERLDLQSAFEDRDIIHEPDGRKLISTTIPDDVGGSRCPMCRLLHRTRYNGPGKLANKKNRNRRYTLWAASYLRVSELSWDSDASSREHIDVVCILVIPEGFTIQQVFTTGGIWNTHPPPECVLQCAENGPNLALAKSKQLNGQDSAVGRYHGCVIDEYVDLNNLRTSFRRADNLHWLRYDWDFELENILVLINCETRLLEGCELRPLYTALSYVWGSAKSCVPQDWLPTAGQALPKELPRTIEDAIEVTKGLGYTWLWVDQICIDQHDLERRTCQIGSMNRIYESAVLTIIAAAGDNANYGLPGAPSWPRKTHKQYSPTMISGLLLAPSMARPEWLIAKSVWASRGWTYQEGLLSRKRLVFTDEQVYLEEGLSSIVKFESVRQYGRNWQEDVSYPGFRLGYFNGGCSGRPTYRAKEDRERHAVGLSDHLKAYLRRHLTHKSDILFAFLGIINHFGKTSCWGLPINFHEIEHLRETGVYGEKSFARCAHDEFVCLLGWRHCNVAKSKRRNGFPSFSWTGWSGAARLESKHLLSSRWATVRPRIEVIDPSMKHIGLVETESIVVEAELLVLQVRRLTQHSWSPVDSPVAQKISNTVFRLELPEYSENDADLECIRIAEDNLMDPKDYHLRCSLLLVIARHHHCAERRGLLRVQEQYHDWIQALPHRNKTLILH